MLSRWEELKKNSKLRENLVARDFVIRKIREWFYNEGFTEVETPALVALPGMEPYLNPFKTKVYNEQGREHEVYLITSPEYAMKKLLAAGFLKIFQICKCFRNGEEFGGLHNPEFTMIEWYRARSDYFKLMEDCEKMITSIYFEFLTTAHKSEIRTSARGGSAFGGKFETKPKLKYQNLEIALSLPWERLSVKKAFQKFCNLNLDNLLTSETIALEAEKRGYKVENSFRYEDVFFKIFLQEIETNLGKNKPTFLYDYPIQLGALARAKKDDPRYSERVELYIGGLEIANGFSELNDLGEQRKRLEEEKALRRAQGKNLYSVDDDFIKALGEMPESAGIALGIDRLLMILLDARDINEVISFPAVKEFRI